MSAFVLLGHRVGENLCKYTSLSELWLRSLLEPTLGRTMYHGDLQIRYCYLAMLTVCLADILVGDNGACITQSFSLFPSFSLVFLLVCIIKMDKGQQSLCVMESLMRANNQNFDTDTHGSVSCFCD